METKNESIGKSAPVNLTDGSGAMPEGRLADRKTGGLPWYVLWVKTRTEKSVRDSLLQAGFEAFAATRFETHLWRRGERRKVETVVVPSVVFVRMERQDRPLVERQPNVSSLMRDPARKGARSKGGEEYAIVSADDMEVFRQMLVQEDVEVRFATTEFCIGEYVRIKDFNEDHNIARVVRIIGDSKPYVGLRVSFLGCAYMKMPLDRIVKLDNN